MFTRADRGGIIAMFGITSFVIVYHLWYIATWFIIYGCYLIWQDK